MTDDEDEYAGYKPPPQTKGEREARAAIGRIIERLPKAGAVLIVHSASDVPAVRRMIAERRGAEISKVTRVLAAPSADDEAVMLKAYGLNMQVFRDPFLKKQREHGLALRRAA